MNVDKPAPRSAPEVPARVSQGDPTVAVLIAVQNHLEQQTKLLQKMNEELVAFRTTQASYGETLAKMDRHLRWARWGRRIRLLFSALFWLGIVGIVVYYWADLSAMWNDWSRNIL